MQTEIMHSKFKPNECFHWIIFLSSGATFIPDESVRCKQHKEVSREFLITLNTIFSEMVGDLTNRL